MKPIRIENGVIVYYGNLVGRVSDGCAVVDLMFQGEELKSFLEKQKNIWEMKWKDGVFDRLMSGVKENRDTQMLKDCRVWQLKPDVDIRMKFIDYMELLRDFGPPDSDNYQMVFDGEVDTNDLEALYTKFNTDHPAGYEGHSLSMSDVLELYDESGSTFHYVDRFGFQQVDFDLSALEMKMMGLSPKEGYMNYQDERTLITASLNSLRAYAEHLAAAGLESNRDKIGKIRNLTEWMASFHCVEGHEADPDVRIGKKYLEPLDALLAGKTTEKPDFDQTHIKSVIKGLNYYREELEAQCEPVYDHDIQLCTEMLEDMKIKLAQEESQAWGQTMQF